MATKLNFFIIGDLIQIVQRNKGVKISGVHDKNITFTLIMVLCGEIRWCTLNMARQSYICKRYYCFS